MITAIFMSSVAAMFLTSGSRVKRIMIPCVITVALLFIFIRLLRRAPAVVTLAVVVIFLMLG